MGLQKFETGSRRMDFSLGMTFTNILPREVA
jgi:hypothetical protein